MKIDEIIIKDKCIVLGIFRTDTFKKVQSLSTGDNYPISYGTFWVKSTNFDGSVVEVVKGVFSWTNQIIFVLDEVKFPINPHNSLTCGELLAVCENEEAFKKTIFVKGENVIDFDRNLVLT